MTGIGTLSVLVLGATGGLGRAVMETLLKYTPELPATIVTRRPWNPLTSSPLPDTSFPPAGNSRGSEAQYRTSKVESAGGSVSVYVLPNFDNLEKIEEAFKVRAVICALGASRKADGVAGVVKVDYEYAVKAATIARRMGVEQFHFISTAGADINSNFLYFETKGRAEKAIEALNFPWLYIYRPRVLLVKRDKWRPLDSVAQLFLGATDVLNILSISGEDLAAVIVKNMLTTPAQTSGSSQTRIITNSDAVSGAVVAKQFLQTQLASSTVKSQATVKNSNSLTELRGGRPSDPPLLVNTTACDVSTVLSESWRAKSTKKAIWCLHDTLSTVWPTSIIF